MTSVPGRVALPGLLVAVVRLALLATSKHTLMIALPGLLVSKPKFLKVAPIGKMMKTGEHDARR